MGQAIHESVLRTDLLRESLTGGGTRSGGLTSPSEGTHVPPRSRPREWRVAGKGLALILSYARRICQLISLPSGLACVLSVALKKVHMASLSRIGFPIHGRTHSGMEKPVRNGTAPFPNAKNLFGMTASFGSNRKTSSERKKLFGIGEAEPRGLRSHTPQSPHS
jgi:hypothetical protein